ncbi:Protein ROT1 [Candida viswanathii]|uniref:Protein ROT1 n=1 Tax=Candida viswanathii TaxID=5486 RepID=A0A367Y1Q1_9ASCO|nr:Protein ROT1 [Candida viswanathii]
MMYFLEVLLFYVVSVVVCERTPAIQGTWQSQSGQVITGTLFFEPGRELLKEPQLPGISYSFDARGHYELAAYVITLNNKNHGCPLATLTWQHGNYKFHKGKLILRPVVNDGRQLVSDPCGDEGLSEYKRFVEGETLEVDVRYDEIVGAYKLVLVDYLTGRKKQPMWLTLNVTNDTMLPTGVITSKKRKYVKKE